MLGLLHDPLQRLAVVLRPGAAAAQRHLGLAAQHRQRRAQLVADVGQEQHPQPVEVLEPAVGLLELGGALAHLALEQRLLLEQGTVLLLELIGHPVEVARQQRQLVASVDRDAAGRELGPVYASVNHGRVLDTANHAGVGKPWNLVFSADAELLPGLVLAGDVAYFDNDLDREARDAADGDSGWVWVTRLELAF